MSNASTSRPHRIHPATLATRAILAAVLSPLALAGAASAQGGAALELGAGGGSHYASLGNDPSLKPSAAFTLEAWVRPEDAHDAWGGAGFILSDGRDCCNPVSQGGVGLHLASGQAARCYLWDDDGQVAVVGLPMDPLAWHHVACVFDGTSLVVYQDGVETGANVLAGPTTVRTNGLDLLLGIVNFQVPVFYPFRGRIDEVRVWSVARTAGEICAALAGPIANDEPGLAAWYPLDEGGGQELADLSPNANTGRLGASPGPDTHDPAWVLPGVAPPAGPCSAGSPASPGSGAPPVSA